MTDQSEMVQCRRCELIQLRTVKALCRRCGRPLHRGKVETTMVVVVTGPAEVEDGTLKTTMMRRVRQAVARNRSMKAAAKELGIDPSRLKRYLREMGDHQDYRHVPGKDRQP